MNLNNFFYMILYMYIAPGQGLTTPWDKILMSTGTSCHFSHMLQVSKNLLEVWFYTVNVHYQGQTAPRGQSFDVNRYVLSLHSFVASFKKNVFEIWFYKIFFSWFNTCSPGAGAERPQGTKFWCQQKGLITFPIFITFPICCKFQRNLFEVWFYTIVFMT